MCRERQQHSINQHYVLEVVDHTLPIQKVHRCPQEIPVERLGKAKTPRARGHVRDSNDLLETDDLDCCHGHENVYVAREHGAEEDGNHDEGPDGAGDKGLLLLFEIGWFGLVVMGMLARLETRLV